ncbi:hypothetical protein K469DRAFT_554525, partial [Zopfia rhizophila CBS 207.26]
TYLKHYYNKLNIKLLFFNLCLFITKDYFWTIFGVIGIQIDNTLILYNNAFFKLEEK